LRRFIIAALRNEKQQANFSSIEMYTNIYDQSRRLQSLLLALKESQAPIPALFRQQEKPAALLAVR